MLFCRCLIIPLEEKNLQLMFHHPLFQSRLKVRLKLLTVRDFVDASIVVERVVKFDTLGTTLIPGIFEAKDWADLFKKFEDLIDELVKEFYSNARYTRVKL